MDGLVLLVFFSVSIPLALSLALLEKKARVTVAYMIIGMLVALIVSQINSILLSLFDHNNDLFVTTITPVTEEIIKALPILYYAFVFKPERGVMINISLAIGLGFAIFENLIMLANSGYSATIIWVLIRGFGAGLMHSLCTVMVGMCTIYIRQNKRLFLCGIFSVLSLAIIYHSIYNCLVISEYKYLGILLPLLTYSPFVIHQIKTRRNNDESV